MPREVEASHDRVIALASGAPSTIMESFAALSAGLQHAVGKMAADDVTLEVDASPHRLIVKFRAYKHRK